MPLTCCVDGCHTNYKKTINYDSVHRFPKEKVLINKWIELLNLPAGFEPSKNSRVCGKHFDKNFLKNHGNKHVRLDKNAIPNQWQSTMVRNCELKNRSLKNNDKLKSPIDQKQDDNRIENFKELCDVLIAKKYPDWNLFNQPNGICFFRLNCDENFNDVNFSIKILINKEMKVKIFSNDLEAKNEELDWVLNECHLQLWSQFEAILNNYKQETEIKFKANSLHHLKSAQKCIQKVINTFEVSEVVKMINEELDLLIKNEIPEEDLYHTTANDVFGCLLEHTSDINDDPLKEEIVVKIEPELCDVKANVEFINMDHKNQILVSDEVEIKNEDEIEDNNENNNEDEDEFNKCYEPESIIPQINPILYRTEIIPISNSSIKSIVIFKCQKCTKKFDSELKLRNHLDTHPIEEPEKCPIESCNKIFTLRSTLKAHLWSSHNTSSSICHICGKKFAGTKNLKAHLTTHDESTKLPCPQCGIIISKVCLNKHIRTVHDKMKNYKCSHCGKEFADSYAKKLHEQRHEDNKLNEPTPNKTNRLKYSYKCFECPRKFVTKLQAQKHLEELHAIVINNIDIYCFECKAEFEDYRNHAHGHNCKFICKKCGLRFVNKDKLSDHQKAKHSENESRPHACDSCELAFKTENHLRSHKVMIHSTQQKKYHCADCNFKFHFKHELKIHMRVHTNDLHYKCPICSLSFKQLNAMKRHVSLDHGTDEIYKCINCSEKFKTLNELKAHRQQHGVTMNVQKYFDEKPEDELPVNCLNE